MFVGETATIPKVRKVPHANSARNAPPTHVSCYTVWVCQSGRGSAW
jgi:hypothetical protein